MKKKKKRRKKHSFPCQDMFLPLTFQSGVFSHVSRIQLLACGYSGWKIVSCSVKTFLVLKMSLICIPNTKWMGEQDSHKDHPVVCYCTFLRPAALTSVAYILNFQPARTGWEPPLACAETPGFPIASDIYCKNKFLLLIFLLQQDLSFLERNLFSSLQLSSSCLASERKWMFL